VSIFALDWVVVVDSKAIIRKGMLWTRVGRESPPTESRVSAIQQHGTFVQ
jgi:hypothetical protein